MKSTMSIFLCMAFLMATQSCKQKSEDVLNAGIQEESIPESFFNFYNRFHTDSVFQMEHIAFPIPEQEDGKKYTEESWIINKAFSVDEVNYQRKLQSTNGIIYEIIYHTQGIFTLERRFTKLSDESWNLIFYKVSNELDDGWQK